MFVRGLAVRGSAVKSAVGARFCAALARRNFSLSKREQRAFGRIVGGRG